MTKQHTSNPKSLLCSRHFNKIQKAPDAFFDVTSLFNTLVSFSGSIKFKSTYGIHFKAPLACLELLFFLPF